MASDAGDVSDVVFLGIASVLPLINQDMLLYPHLCKNYIILVSRLISNFPHKLISLPSHILENLTSSVEYGMQTAMYEVAREAFEAIVNLAQWVRKHEVQGMGSWSIIRMPG